MLSPHVSPLHLPHISPTSAHLVQRGEVGAERRVRALTRLGPDEGLERRDGVLEPGLGQGLGVGILEPAGLGLGLGLGVGYG